MARYRLRFLLQEVELRRGETLIGRSPFCEVSIEDPLVSREHARITVQGGNCTLEDLGSRNGTHLDGAQLKGKAPLVDGSRIRIGTQEMVFSVVDAPPAGTGRTTGFMTRCAGCSTPYPAEAAICPTCGGTDRFEDDTLSGAPSDGAHNWTLQLIIEVLERAQSGNRVTDVERLLNRARANIESRAASRGNLDVDQVVRVAEIAAWFGAHPETVEEHWAVWSLDVLHVVHGLPSLSLCESLHEVPEDRRSAVAEAAERLLALSEEAGGPASGADARTSALRALAGSG